MTNHRTRWLLVGLVCLALWPAPARAQVELWEEYSKAGVEAFQGGDFAEARRQFAASLGVATRLGADSPYLAQSLNGLAEVHRAQGNLDDAERLHRGALAIREKTLEPDHPAVAQSQYNLAEVLRAQGKLAAAETLYERARAVRGRIAAQASSWQGDMDAADAAYLRGDHAGAEKLLLAAVARAEGFGSRDPRLARSLNNLAELNRVQRRYADAEATHRRALAIIEKTLGPESSEVATSLNNLALLYHLQGRHGEAGPLYQRALAIREKAFGPEHPAVAQSLNNMAAHARDQLRYDEAERLYQRSLAIVAKALGPEHPQVATSLENYAATLRAIGRGAEATEMESQARTIRAKHAKKNPVK